jgi:hypothetical protein
MWSSPTNSTSSWSETAADKASKAADRFATATESANDTASRLADELKGGASHAVDQTSKAADSVGVILALLAASLLSHGIAGLSN